MGAERRALVLIVGARALSVAVALACLAAVLHAVAVGRAPVPLLALAVALFGATLVLVAILREQGTERQSAALVAVVMVGWAAWALMQQLRDPDAVAVLGRGVGAAILGEVWLWRLLTIARGLQRWREVRNDALFALAAIVVTALVGGPIDRAPLPLLGLAVATVGAVALSFARSTEELALSTGQVRGRQEGASATGTAFGLGVLALALGLALPWLEVAVGTLARTLASLLSSVLFVVLLPLGYLAASLVGIVLWLRERLQLGPRSAEVPLPPQVADDAERLREIADFRVYVAGAVELIVAAVVLLIAVMLVARLVGERRAVLAEGVTLEREGVEGIGLRATLRGLFRERAAPRRAPPDDGTPAAALRRLYWRLLEIAERDGPGWRAPAETPAEHEARLVTTAGRWRDAAPLVRAFEALRYGDVDPDATTLERARDGLRRVERVPPGA